MRARKKLVPQGVSRSGRQAVKESGHVRVAGRSDFCGENVLAKGNESVDAGRGITMYTLLRWFASKRGIDRFTRIHQSSLDQYFFLLLTLAVRTY